MLRMCAAGLGLYARPPTPMHRSPKAPTGPPSWRGALWGGAAKGGGLWVGRSVHPTATGRCVPSVADAARVVGAQRGRATKPGGSCSAVGGVWLPGGTGAPESWVRACGWVLAWALQGSWGQARRRVAPPLAGCRSMTAHRWGSCDGRAACARDCEARPQGKRNETHAVTDTKLLRRAEQVQPVTPCGRPYLERGHTLGSRQHRRPARRCLPPPAPAWRGHAVLSAARAGAPAGAGCTGRAAGGGTHSSAGPAQPAPPGTRSLGGVGARCDACAAFAAKVAAGSAAEAPPARAAPRCAHSTCSMPSSRSSCGVPPGECRRGVKVQPHGDEVAAATGTGPKRRPSPRTHSSRAHAPRLVRAWRINGHKRVHPACRTTR